jgi:hypothetical protein
MPTCERRVPSSGYYRSCLSPRLLAPGLRGGSLAPAQEWPARPVKIIVAFTAGGTRHMCARTQRLTEPSTSPSWSRTPWRGRQSGTGSMPGGARRLQFTVNSVGPMAVNPTLYKTCVIR